MSAPIRVQVEADETTQEQVGVMPSLPEDEPGDEITNATLERVEQPTTADSDLTMETSRIMVTDQPGTQHLEEASETRQGTEQASAVPLIARTLKNPPEIWDLVQETPVQFNPSGAFVARLTSSKTKLVLLMLVMVCISTLAAFAITTLRDSRNRVGASAQLQEERSTSQTVPASQPSDPASVPETGLNAPVNAESNTPPAAGDGVANTLQPTDSQPTDPRAGDLQATEPRLESAVSADSSLTENGQPTGVSVSNVSKRNASVRPAAVLSGNKNSIVAVGGQKADESRSALGENETPARPNTSSKSQAAQAPTAGDVKRSNEKSSSDSVSAKKRSDTGNPQVIAPPPATSTAPKAKVIQWP
jgi:hypothetical protein